MIRLQNVSKSFADVKVLQNINLNIKETQSIVLTGISGSGKSTLLSIIGGILKPTSGLVQVDGYNIVSLNDFYLSKYRSNSVGYITQSFHLFDRLSVRDNVIAPLLLKKLTQKQIQLLVDEAMIKAQIIHKQNQKVFTLSGGEKQRCMIARALVNNPKIILCDEPTANLDKQNSLKFIEILKELKESAKTIVIATHDPLLSELDWIDKIIKIDEGQIE
jgi:putative ABC transport system ATP-binding protein